MFSRRDFFKRAGLTIAAATAAGTIGELDVDKLLWLPKAKTIFIPDHVEVHAITQQSVGDYRALLQARRRAEEKILNAYADRYVLTTGGQGLPAVRVTFNENWEAKKGEKFAGPDLYFTPEELAAFTADIKNADPSKLPAFPEMRLRDQDRFVERIAVDLPRTAAVPDADSRPGWFQRAGYGWDRVGDKKGRV